MKLVMIIVDGQHKEELEVLLRQAGAGGYTEIPGATGLGMTGPKLGSGAYPKTSAVVFTVVDDPLLADLRARLRRHCEGCGERLKLLAWEVDAAGISADG